jgi:DNA-binding transcriptional MerR regulator
MKGTLTMQAVSTSPMLTIPAKLYRIGELVRYTPFSRQTIHNYTIMGLIREVEWTDGGHRLYSEDVFERLSRIIELKKTRTLDEIRRILIEEDAAEQIVSGQDGFGEGLDISPEFEN